MWVRRERIPFLLGSPHPSPSFRREGMVAQRSRRFLKPLSKSFFLRPGYKCANPTCRNVFTLELHHIVWVKDGGGNEPDNLLVLCPNCHAPPHQRAHTSSGGTRLGELADFFGKSQPCSRGSTPRARRGRRARAKGARFRECTTSFPLHWRLLACALASNANLIVSHDLDLLRPRTFKTIGIVSPIDFLNTLGLKQAA
jgi:hypothetical protein